MLSYKLFITGSECVRESIRKLNVKCVKSNVCKSLTAQVVLQALIFFFRLRIVFQWKTFESQRTSWITKKKMVSYIAWWKKKYYNLCPLWGFEPQTVCSNKAIPAEWGVSCAPLGACLLSRPEERCSADGPYFGLTLWYLGVSSKHFCFFFYFVFVFDETRIVDKGIKPGGC